MLDFRSGFPKPSLLKTETGEIIIKSIPVDSKSAIGGKYTKEQANPFLSLISNITILGKIPLTRNAYYKFHSLYVNRLTRENESPPSINEIYKWSVENSKKIHPNVIWLLQYDSEISENDLMERKYIRDLLTMQNIKFIDTYEQLHGKEVKYSSSKLWNGHYTPLGNRVVCETIFKNINSSN